MLTNVILSIGFLFLFFIVFFEFDKKGLCDSRFHWIPGAYLSTYLRVCIHPFICLLSYIAINLSPVRHFRGRPPRPTYLPTYLSTLSFQTFSRATPRTATHLPTYLPTHPPAYLPTYLSCPVLSDIFAGDPQDSPDSQALQLGLELALRGRDAALREQVRTSDDLLDARRRLDTLASSSHPSARLDKPNNP